jgi:hypothetical protein
LKNVIFPLTAHITSGDTVQFSVNKGRKLFERKVVSVAPGDEQLS